MILVADGGASKTDWAIIENGKLSKLVQAVGISPIFHSVEDIFSLVKNTFSNENFSNNIEQIYFYGAGCIKGHTSAIIEEGLKLFFKTAKIDAQSDMLGAARALFKDEAGIACILGTGANSCKYDGKIIAERIPPLGYILGDECSGAYLGKTLINNYFKKVMPNDLAAEFFKEYQISEKEVLDRVYKQASPNQYLANFSPFLKKHEKHPYVQNIIKSAFQTFLDYNITKYSDYKNYKIGFIGSIGFYFGEIIGQILEERQIVLNKILEKPIEGLIEYHSN
jgi:N-acetylglucosamine kinase-like BadF-type ATPase